MKSLTHRALAAIAIAVAALLAPAVAANAQASPGFSSTYAVHSVLWGSSHFQTTGNGTVTVRITATSWPSELLDVRVEQQTCGLFACHWDEHYVGGTCTRLLSPGASAICTFKTGVSPRDARLVISKRDDGLTMRGKVTVS